MSPCIALSDCEYPLVQIRRALSNEPSNHVGHNAVSKAIVLVFTRLGGEGFCCAFS